MPLRAPKMYGFIFGFQRLVWWPKWTPASSSCFIVMAEPLDWSAPAIDSAAGAATGVAAATGVGSGEASGSTDGFCGSCISMCSLRFLASTSRCVPAAFAAPERRNILHPTLATGGADREVCVFTTGAS